jgi:hypothetical protein
MEKFKIENLKKSINFINLEKSGDTLYFLNNIIRILDIKNDVNNIFNCIYSKLTKSVSISEVEDGELLKKTLLSIISVNDSDLIYIFWAIDIPSNLILVRELFENWDSFFYSTSDEAVILFLPAYDKVFLLTHYGEMRYN